MKLPLPLVRASIRWTVRPLYGPPVPIGMQRAVSDLLARSQRMPRGVRHRDVVLGGRRARRFTAPGASADTAVLWVHGGAFITGSWATHGSFAAHLARESGMPVYLLDYRLAPEHRHPAAVQDVVAALADVPEARVVLGGDSAGGCLALLAIGAGAEAAGLALVSPLVDLTHETARQWTGEESLVRDEWTSAGVAAMFGADLPVVPEDVEVPVVVHVAEHERLRPEGEALAGRLGAELVVVRRGWHDIHLQAGILREAEAAVRLLGASVKGFVSAARP